MAETSEERVASTRISFSNVYEELADQSNQSKLTEMSRSRNGSSAIQASIQKSSSNPLRSRTLTNEFFQGGIRTSGFRSASSSPRSQTADDKSFSPKEEKGRLHSSTSGFRRPSMLLSKEEVVSCNTAQSSVESEDLSSPKDSSSSSTQELSSPALSPVPPTSVTSQRPVSQVPSSAKSQQSSSSKSATIPTLKRSDIKLNPEGRCGGFLKKMASKTSLLSKGKLQERFFFINLDIKLDQNYCLEYGYRETDFISRETYPLEGALVVSTGETTFRLTLISGISLILDAGSLENKDLWISSLQTTISVAYNRGQYLKERASSTPTPNNNNNNYNSRLVSLEEAALASNTNLTANGQNSGEENVGYDMPVLSAADIRIGEIRNIMSMTLIGGMLKKKSKSYFYNGKLQDKYFFIKLNIKDHQNYSLAYTHNVSVTNSGPNSTPQVSIGAVEDILPLDGGNVVALTGNFFQVTTSLLVGKTIVVEAPSIQMREKWISTLEKAIEIAGQRAKIIKRYGLARNVNENGRSSSLGGRTSSVSNAGRSSSMALRPSEASSFTNHYNSNNNGNGNGNSKSMTLKEEENENDEEEDDVGRNSKTKKDLEREEEEAALMAMKETVKEAIKTASTIPPPPPPSTPPRANSSAHTSFSEHKMSSALDSIAFLRGATERLGEPLPYEKAQSTSPVSGGSNMSELKKMFNTMPIMRPVSNRRDKGKDKGDKGDKGDKDEGKKRLSGRISLRMAPLATSNRVTISKGARKQPKRKPSTWGQDVDLISATKAEEYNADDDNQVSTNSSEVCDFPTDDEI